MNYKIADTVFSLGDPGRYCRSLLAGYRTDLPEEFEISVTASDILSERQRSEEPISEGYAESLAVLRKLSDRLLTRDTILFHGSAVALDGQAYIFAAPSGTGKSTHARLWREKFGDRVVMINDDKPFVRVGGRCTVYGSPWDGKHRLSTNASFPLRAVCFLERAERNSIAPLSPSEAIHWFLSQAYREEAVASIFPLILKITDVIPSFLLKCNTDPGAVDVAWSALSDSGPVGGEKC